MERRVRTLQVETKLYILRYMTEEDCILRFCFIQELRVQSEIFDLLLVYIPRYSATMAKILSRLQIHAMPKAGINVDTER